MNVHDPMIGGRGWSCCRGMVWAVALAAPALAWGGGGLWAAEAVEPVVVLKLASLAPERSPWAKLMKDAALEVKAATAGRVAVQVYPGGVQGDEPTVIRKMRIGQLHGGTFLGRGLSQACPDSLVLQLPLLFNNQKEVDYVVERFIPYLDKEADRKGYEVLGWTKQGFNYVYSRDPVKDAATMRTGRTWLLEDDLFLRVMFRVAGVPPVPAQVADVLTGLQSGLMRTVYAPPAAMVALQWHTRVKYRLDFGLSHSFGAVVVAKSAWEKVPEADRAPVAAIMHRLTDDLNAVAVKQNAEALAVMDRQLTKLEFTPEALAEFRQINEKVKQELAGSAFSHEALRMVESYLAEYRKGQPSP